MSDKTVNHGKKRALAALMMIGMAFFVEAYGGQLSPSAHWRAFVEGGWDAVAARLTLREGVETARGVSEEEPAAESGVPGEPEPGNSESSGETGTESGVGTEAEQADEEAEAVPAALAVLLSTEPTAPPLTPAASVGTGIVETDAVFPLLPNFDSLMDPADVRRVERQSYLRLLASGLMPAPPVPEVPEEPAAPEEPEPEPEPIPRNPLTGLPMDEAAIRTRPKAVILNNLKQAQPQFGNSKADIIYEVPAEGGVTRMLALYQRIGDVGTLGSIRSARRYLVELAMGHDALLVHAGGSPEAYRDIQNWNIDNMDGVRGGSDASIFYRDPERRKTMGYEHSMMTSGYRILAYLNRGRYRTERPEGWQSAQTYVEDGMIPAGERATRIEVKFSYYKTGVFEYDPETRRYFVSQYDAPYTDGENGRQVSAVNVLILKTDIAKIPGDTAGRLTVRTTGTGRGWYFCGGRYVSIRWSRADRDSGFVYTRLDGTPLALGQGNSYVCIVDADNVPLVTPGGGR